MSGIVSDGEGSVKKRNAKSALVRVLPDGGRRDRRVLELCDEKGRGGAPIEFYVWESGDVSVLLQGDTRSRLIVTTTALRALADGAATFLAGE